MASYVEEIVGPGETVTYVGHVSFFAILGSLIGGSVLIVAGAIAALGGVVPIGAAVAIVGIGWLASGLIRRASTELAVTNRRVIAKFGLIRRSTVEINLSKIESVRVEQSVMGRLLGYGSIIVTGTGSTMDPIPFISRPIEFRQALQAATDQAPRQ
ncbi:MAG TPA: PH domain-containing protein [Casimicrobiaceae bacterium]|nr:PH domain-containing protein [Casimicrobiaceae bacterium]